MVSTERRFGEINEGYRDKEPRAFRRDFCRATLFGREDLYSRAY